MTSVHTVENGTEGKECPACQQWHSLPDFGKNKLRNDGLTRLCKICKNQDARLRDRTPENRIKNTARVRRYRQTKSGQVACRRADRNNRTRHPEKMSAGSAVAYAVMSGRLPRTSSCACADCGKQAEHHHHESYEKEHWLDVVPLCRRCHMIRHGTVAF